MDGVVTLLDPIHTQKTLVLWQELKNHCGVPEIKNHLAPHFTWHVAEGYVGEKLIPALQEICQQTKPFCVRSSGIGVFPGQKPVIHISLMKDRKLLDFHEELWCRINEFAHTPSPLYAPENWVPHITIFFEEIYNQVPPDWNGQAASQCAIKYLLSQQIDWEIQVENFAYGCMDNDEMRLSTYRFGSQA
jgi:2'-5' RNA ligase